MSKKRYKILTREEYEKQISKEEKNATKNVFLTGISAAAAIMILSRAAGQDVNIATRIFYSSLGIINSFIVNAFKCC